MKLIARLTIALILSLSTTHWVLAQSTFEDPLGKPELWAEIMDEPDNQTLWKEYLGKVDEKLSAQDISLIKIWRAEVYKQLQADAKWSALTLEATERVFDQEELIEAEQVQHYNSYVKAMNAELEELNALKDNIETNFVLIEAILEDAYHAEGLIFQRLQLREQMEIDEIKSWIDQHEERLINHRLRAINEEMEMSASY